MMTKTTTTTIIGPKGLRSCPAAGAEVLSMVQRVMMEAERGSAIKRYREMKECKTKEADWTLLTH